jgi:hypothetical protein
MSCAGGLDKRNCFWLDSCHCYHTIVGIMAASRRQNKAQGKPKKTKGKSEETEPKLTAEDIPSASYLAIIWQYLTEALCEAVFATTRINERRRKWTLFMMTWFWISLLQSQYTSQTRALNLVKEGGSPLFPWLKTSPASFFKKAQNTRLVFFRNLFLAFTMKVLAAAQPCFERDLLPFDEAQFPNVYAWDGSRLAKVARRLKIAQNTTKAIIPGSMEAVYDLRRGVLHNLYFDPDGCVSEMKMVDQVLDGIQKGALLHGDRAYSKPYIWRKLDKRGLFMITRYNKTVKKRRLAVIDQYRSYSLNFDDYLMKMGSSKQGEEPVQLRLVHIWGRGPQGRRFDYTLVTNVLDPKRLTPIQIMGAYRRRWSVERMYLAMKDILNLNHLYNCSPAAVGQQVYATAIIYNALRLSQAKIAAAAGIAPELLSPDKLFPVLMEHYVRAIDFLAGMHVFAKMERCGPPDLTADDLKLLDILPWTRIHIRDYLLEKRSDHRRKRRFCVGRSRVTGYDDIPGGKRLLAA